MKEKRQGGGAPNAEGGLCLKGWRVLEMDDNILLSPLALSCSFLTVRGGSRFQAKQLEKL